MPKRTTIILLTIAGVLFLLFVIFLLRLFSTLSDSPFTGTERIAVLNIKGTIMNAQPYQDALYRFRKDRRVKGVVVRIDSPGGAVGPSQEIYREILKYQTAKGHEKKPIIASLGSVAASGGYYIAAACPQIMANPGTLTGSIGVIAQFPNYEGVLKWARVGVQILKAGNKKDLGSPYRSMGDDEKAFFSQLLDNVHLQFIQDVAKGRRLSIAKVKPFADGRVMTGEQAKTYGLVDRFGNLRDAIALIAKQANIQGEPRVFYAPRQRVSLFGELVQGTLRDAIEQIKATPSLPKSSLQLYYLWPSKGVIQ